MIDDRLTAALRAARRVVVLTGAGMSAESGVPTFRGAGGLWKTYRAEDLATPQAFRRDPALVWAWYRSRQRAVAAAAPHAGHAALVRLAGRVPLTLVTQNVDGLHQRAGSRDVIELHGSLWRLTCSAGCPHVAEARPEAVPDDDAPLPRCVCGALQRPGVVWFGEQLPEEPVAAAWAAAADCDVLLSVGTSSIVYPAAALPSAAREAGAVIAEINPEPTPLTAHAEFVLRAPAAEALMRLEVVL